MAMKKATAISAAPRPSQSARGHERHAGGERDQDRLEDEAELRHAEVELGLEGGETDQQAAHERRAARTDEQPVRARRPALGLLAGAAPPPAAWHAEQRHRRAADQHQVRGAPEGHVLAEQAVPDVVEREADQREGAAAQISTPPTRRVPVAADLHGARLGFSRGSTIARKPAAKMPNRPIRMK